MHRYRCCLCLYLKHIYPSKTGVPSNIPAFIHDSESFNLALKSHCNTDRDTELTGYKAYSKNLVVIQFHPSLFLHSPTHSLRCSSSFTWGHTPLIENWTVNSSQIRGKTQYWITRYKIKWKKELIKLGSIQKLCWWLSSTFLSALISGIFYSWGWTTEVLSK